MKGVRIAYVLFGTWAILLSLSCFDDLRGPLDALHEPCGASVLVCMLWCICHIQTNGSRTNSPPQYRIYMYINGSDQTPVISLGLGYSITWMMEKKFSQFWALRHMYVVSAVTAALDTALLIWRQQHPRWLFTLIIFKRRPSHSIQSTRRQVS